MSSSSTQAQTQSGTSTQDPWSVQTPYLTQAFQGAQTALGKAQTATAPTNFTAQYTPDQLAAFSKMLNYGTGNGNIAGSSANAGGVLNTAGANATAAGLNGLAGFTPQGGTQSNINAANAYVAGQNIPAQVNADMLTARQQASEQDLPGIARNAAGSGNINSNRTAIEGGIVNRGIAQEAGADAARLQGQDYTTGLGLAEQNSEAHNSNALSALMGATSGGTSAVNAGTNANSGAVGQQGGLFDIATGGIAGQNAGAQANLTNQQQQFDAQTNDPFQALMNYYGLVGANNWGGSTTSSGTSNTTSTPSIYQTIGGLMSAGGSLMKSDRRVKKDVNQIGELFDGTPVYRFRYKNDPQNTLHIGLMAQDVEEIMPDAVITIDGIKHVNLDMATANAMVD